jgi:hypothetical protein
VVDTDEACITVLDGFLPPILPLVIPPPLDLPKFPSVLGRNCVLSKEPHRCTNRAVIAAIGDSRSNLDESAQSAKEYSMLPPKQPLPNAFRWSAA